MTDFSEEKFLTLNQIGLIPGPQETQEAFIKRVNYTLNLKDHLPEEIKKLLPNGVRNLGDGDLDQTDVLMQAANRLKKLYDCSPEWIPLFFSNYKLPFWHGGCAWIFQMTEDSPTSALIQLRQAFSRSSTYLGIYDRKELLTHELSHVGRMMFQEPKFEELLAYRTADSFWRRWMGPLVQSSLESALFLLLLFMLIVFDVFLLALNRPDAYFFALWLKLIPLAAFAAAFGRLWIRQKTYAKCLKNLVECVGLDKAQGVAYRLQDHEIALFSNISPDEINAYAASKMNDELRWQVIYIAYFYGSAIRSQKN